MSLNHRDILPVLKAIELANGLRTGPRAPAQGTSDSLSVPSLHVFPSI